MKKIFVNEVTLPNDACIHQQVIYHAYNKLSGVKRVGSAPRSESMQTLNLLPKVKVINCHDDQEVFNKIRSVRSNPSILLSPGLYDSTYGRSLIEGNSLSFHRLDDSLDISKIENTIFVLGLEKGWSSDVPQDRICLNRLRKISRFDINLMVVSSRNGSGCVPSLVVHDY